MKVTGSAPPHPGSRHRESGSSHRKRKLEQVTARLGGTRRRDSARKTKRRRTPGGDETRQWVFSPRDLSCYKSRFVVVSYNILGVQNVSKHSDLYHQVPPEHLSWDQRKKRLCKELTIYNPSIMCFQEVDRFDDLANLLQEDGFVGVYMGRTGDASDGCAIFWKKEHFALVHQENIEYQKYGLRDNVAQLCLFKVCHNQLNVSTNKDASAQVADHTLLVGNIHVLFNPNRGDIKLGQVRLLLEKAHKISQQWGNSPAVICGDLNSMPQSALYQFMSSPELDISMHDRKKISGQIDVSFRQRPFSTPSDASSPPFCISKFKYRWSEEEICLAAGRRGCTCLKNPLKLYSAYQGVPQGSGDTRSSNGEPLVTSYHSKFMGTVDYIWHSAALVPVGVVETLPIKILRRLGGLPSKKWGSDHLALVCELAFVDDPRGANILHVA